MSIGWQQILILLLIFVVLFGAKKLPDVARALGRSARILRAETKGLADEEPEDGGEQREGQAPSSSATAQGGAHPNDQRPHPQQPGYPQLPPGARVVDESSEPMRYYGENRP